MACFAAACSLALRSPPQMQRALRLARRRPARRWKQHRSSRRYWRHMLGGGEALPDSDCNGGTVVAARKFDLPFKVWAARPEPRCRLHAWPRRKGRPCSEVPLPHPGVPACLQGLRRPPPQVRVLAGPLIYVLAISALTAAYHELAEVRAPLLFRWARRMLAQGAAEGASGIEAPPRAGAAPQAGKVPPASWARLLGNNAPFQLTSFALSLLLVFRTNARRAAGGKGAPGGARGRRGRRGCGKAGVGCMLPAAR